MREPPSPARTPGAAAPAEDGLRAFLAIPRDPMWVESARNLVETLRPALPEAAWTRPSAWHLTVKFLGNASPRALDAFAEAVAPEAAKVVPGELRAREAVVFPKRGPARVLAIGFSESEAIAGLDRLFAAADKEARRLGLEKEDRPFHPHVTLARIKSRWPPDAVERFRQEVAAWSFPPWHGRACVLYTSRLEPAGAVHTPVAEWSFTGGARGVPA